MHSIPSALGRCRAALIAVALWILPIADVSWGQNFLPPSPVPPNLGFQSGGSGQGGAVNPIAGNLTMSLPMGALPAGPAGQSVGVSLNYNSAFYQAYVDNNGSGGTQLRITYGNNPAGGWQSGSWNSGGWSYGLRYILWSTQELVGNAGNSMYLTTGDGSSHLLFLTSAAPTSGAALPTSTFNTKYPGQPVYDVNFDGICLVANANCVSSHFNGTLVFATADSSFIRVEADTVNNRFTAFFADGGTVDGNWYTAGANNGANLAAEGNTIRDRHGNTITLTNFCIESSTCTTVITDQFGREVDLNYGAQGSSFPTQWNDTITQPGPNGTLTTIVKWQPYTFTGPSYDCLYQGSQVLGTKCPLTTGTLATLVTPYVVTSIQMPSATTGGVSTVLTFNYDVPANQDNWGELHQMSQWTLASGTDVSACTEIGRAHV